MAAICHSLFPSYVHIIQVFKGYQGCPTIISFSQANPTALGKAVAVWFSFLMILILSDVEYCFWFL